MNRVDAMNRADAMNRVDAMNRMDAMNRVDAMNRADAMNRVPTGPDVDAMNYSRANVKPRSASQSRARGRA